MLQPTQTIQAGYRKNQETRLKRTRFYLYRQPKQHLP